MLVEPWLPLDKSGAAPAPLMTFEELAVPLLASLYNFALWLTRNQEDAEDLVQEACIKGLKHFNTFQAGTNFRAWMFRIERNAFLNSRTSLAAKLTVPLDEDEHPGFAVTNTTPESLAIVAADRKILHSALESLPLRYREVIVLSDVEDFKYREIAEMLEIPLGTVMSRIARGRAALRQLLLERGFVQPAAPRRLQDDLLVEITA